MVDLLAAAVVQVVTVRWFAGIVLLGVIVLAITLETPGLMFRHLQHVLQAVMISGEVIVPFVNNGTNCIFLRDHLGITLVAGINIHHRSMLDIVADAGLQTMVITEWVTGMTEEMVGIIVPAAIVVIRKGMILQRLPF